MMVKTAELIERMDENSKVIAETQELVKQLWEEIRELNKSKKEVVRIDEELYGLALELNKREGRD